MSIPAVLPRPTEISDVVEPPVLTLVPKPEPVAPTKMDIARQHRAFQPATTDEQAILGYMDQVAEPGKYGGKVVDHQKLYGAMTLDRHPLATELGHHIPILAIKGLIRYVDGQPMYTNRADGPVCKGIGSTQYQVRRI